MRSTTTHDGDDNREDIETKRKRDREKEKAREREKMNQKFPKIISSDTRDGKIITKGHFDKWI